MFHSKQLRQQCQLVLDVHLARGEPFEVREAAEQAVRESNGHWGVEDDFDARTMKVMGEFKRLLKAPTPSDLLPEIIPNVPDEIAVILHRLPVAICISEKGGPSSKWVSTNTATIDDFRKNAALKKLITERMAGISATPQEIADLLESHGVNSLQGLFDKLK